MDDEQNMSGDAAATAAARLAAVRRRRRESERAAFWRQLVLVAGALLLIVGVVLVLRITHRQKMEAARLAADAREKELAAAAAERQRAAEAARIQRDREHAARQKAADEQRRANDARRLEAEKKSAAQKALRENQIRYRKLESRFHGMTLSRLSAAPDADRPDRVQRESFFLCLVPGGRRGYDLYEIKATPGFGLQVERQDPEARPVRVSEDTFRQQVASVPYLLLGGAGLYLRPVPGIASRRLFPVPAAYVDFNPAKQELGTLYEAARELGVSAASFSYRVSFRPAAGGGDVFVQDVKFGDDVKRPAFVKALQEAVARQRRVSPSSVPLPTVEKALDGGRVVFSVRGGQ